MEIIVKLSQKRDKEINKLTKEIEQLEVKKQHNQMKH